MLGGRVWYSGTDNYTDIPSTLVAVLEDLDTWLDSHPAMPLLDDPSCPGTSFNHRWDEPLYQTFKTKIHDYAVWAREAYDLQDEDDQAAILAWQKLFGPEFAAEAVNEARAVVLASRSPLFASAGAIEEAAPGEEFIHEKTAVQRRYDARIDAAILGTYPRALRRERVVRTGQKLRFRLRTDTPEPYEVWWKVRNHGAAAARAGDLRGKIFRHGTDGRNQHQESTSYPAGTTSRRTSSRTASWSPATTTT